MQNPRDPEGPGSARPKRNLLFPVAAFILLVVVAVVWFLSRRPAETPVPTPATTEDVPPGEPQEPAELGEEAARGAPEISLPALDESDDFVRNLATRLSTRPGLVRWLVTDGLVRRFVVVVDNIAGGANPRPNLRFLDPEKRFRVRREGRAIYPAFESYSRYDWIADVFCSLDPDASARLYYQLKPLMQQAYRDLGYPEGSFDDRVVLAIRKLLEIPVLQEEPELKPLVLSYAFADSDLEALSPLQKQLLRTGPRNVRRVQQHLREMARALGIRQERLSGSPAPAE